jgi:Tfp pilus assembly protein PilX
MTRPRPPRDPERGNSLLLALIVMSSLATLGSLTVVSVQSSLKSSTNERSQTIAMYAAESGGAIAIDFLRSNFAGNAAWSGLVNANNDPLKTLGFPELSSSGALPGTPDNPFSPDQNAWFSVQLINNLDDPGLATGDDTDAQIIIRSTGHGPQGSVAIVEWEIRRFAHPNPSQTPPDAWAPLNSDPVVLVSWHVVL